MTSEGVAGVGFVLFAPNAQAISVVGDFNFWHTKRHLMRVRGNGYWELFVPGARPGDRYKFAITARDGHTLPFKSDPLAFACEVRPNWASIVARSARAAEAFSGAGKHQCAVVADVDLRGPSRFLATKGRQRLAQLSRARRNAAALCARPRLHAYRVAADQRASIRRFMGLPADRIVRADQPFRPAGRFRPFHRCLSSRRAWRAARLGAGAFPRRPAWARSLRRHGALRTFQPAAGPPPGLGHADLQLRAHRGRQLPGLQRAVLARSLRCRRTARRCRRVHAVSRLQPARGRLDSEQAWRPRESRGDRIPAALQSRSVRQIPARDHRRGRIRPPGRRCHDRPSMAASASATSGTWGGCTTR